MPMRTASERDNQILTIFQAEAAGGVRTEKTVEQIADALGFDSRNQRDRTRVKSRLDSLTRQGKLTKSVRKDEMPGSRTQGCELAYYSLVE